MNLSQNIYKSLMQKDWMNIIISTVWIVLFFFLLPNYIIAQNQSSRFEHLTINNGLSQGSVACIHRDKIGFMWFGTQDGLNRYDGYTFKVYKNIIYDSTSISSNNIKCIDEDVNGDLWVGTSNGLNRLDRKKNKFRQLISSKFFRNDRYSNLISSLWVSHTTNYVWFSTRDGLFKLNKTTFAIEKFIPPYPSPVKDNSVIKIFAYDENLLCLGLLNGDVFLFNPLENIFTKINFKDRKYSSSLRAVSCFAKDGNNDIWIGTHDGLFRYEIRTKKVDAYYYNPHNSNSLAGNFISSIVYHDNFLWIAASGFGLNRFDIKKKIFTNYRNDKFNPLSPNLDVLLDLFMDSNGILWIGTNGNGIDKFNPYLNNFTLYTQTKTGLSFNSIRTFYEDSQGNLWIGGYGGINKLDKSRKNYKYFQYKEDAEFALSNPAVFVITVDKDEPDKYLWIGTEGSGLNRLDMKSNLIDRNPLGDFWRNNLIGQGIYSLLDDREGNLWIGNNKGLDIINKKTRKWQHFEYNASDPTSISPQAINVIYKDNEGRFWIGTDIGGICLVDRTNFKFHHFSLDAKNPTSLSNNFVKCIYQDKKNRLWIGTNGGGLNQFDFSNKKFKRITTEDGLPNDVVYGIVEDANGNLWLSTNHGISLFNPDRNTFTNYDSRDGLQSNEFNTNAFYKNKKEEIYFGGINGFNVFSPSDLIVNTKPPGIAFTNFELFNKPVSIDQEINGRILLSNSIEETNSIELNYDENVFSIEFASLDYTSPQKNKYSYFMEGFDKRWTEPSENRKVTYTNLHSGRYTFKVRGTNNDGVWSTQTAELEIIIIPPFWQTWWFIAFIILLTAAALIVFYRARINGIKKQKEFLENEVNARTSDLAKLNDTLKKSEIELKELNNSKDKFFSILAHDLRGPFSGALGLSEILVEDIEEMDKEGIKSLSYDINQILHEQFILLENLLDWSRIQLNKYQYDPERIDLNEIAVRVHRFLLNNAKSKQVALTLDVPKSIYVIGNPTMLISIMQNLISNSIKFTNASGTIKLSVIEKDSFAVITVEDTGIGMEKEKVDKLFKTDTIVTTFGTANEKGSGLGLLLVKEFVTRLGGNIYVESERLKGSKFIVMIPLDNSQV